MADLLPKTTNMKIHDTPVGADAPVYVIAELSANHNNDLQIAIASVKAAADAGANAIKVQTYSAESMTLDSDRPAFMAREDSLWAGTRLYDLYRKGALPEAWHHELAEVARECGIAFFSAPFDVAAVEFLDALGVPAFKIASLEIVDIPLVRAVAAKGKPIILSAGIASEEDVDLAVQTCLDAGNDQIVLLQCTTQYPTTDEAVNLNGIQWIAQQKGLVAGLSDHTEGHTAAIAAVALGARVVEKHFVLDASLDTLDKEFSLDPAGLREYIDRVRQTERMLGASGYDYSAPKQSARRSARSLIAISDIQPGETLGEHNIKSLRPGIGLHPRYADEVSGRTATRLIERGDGLDWDMISKS